MKKVTEIHYLEKFKIIWKLPKLKNFASKKINSELKIVYSESDTLSIVFQSNELLSGVLGEFNNNLKELDLVLKTASGFGGGNASLILKQL